MTQRYSVLEVAGGWRISKMVFFTLIILFAAVLLPPLSNLSRQISAQKSETKGPGAEWTVFVYMCADNDLEDVGISDFNEMEMVGSGEDLNILVQFDRRPGGDDSNGNWNDTRRFLVEQDYDPSVINSPALDDTLGELDMSDPDTLRDFLEWGIDEYPANRYMLVFWDHGNGLFRRGSGTGETRGFCQDWTNGNDLDVWEASQVFEELSTTRALHFDIVAADVCYFAYLETAYEFREYTDYLIGSSDEEPAAGWNYENALSVFSENPALDSHSVATHIVKKFLEQYDQNYITLMALDIDSMEEDMLVPFDLFCNKLVAEMYDYQSPIRAARSAADNPKTDYVDLNSFVEAIIERSSSLPPDLCQAAEALHDAISLSIVEFGVGNSHPTSMGLALWFPSTFLSSSHRYIYRNSFDFSNLGWDEVLEEYDEPTQVSLSHEPLGDSEDLDGPHIFEASAIAPEGMVSGVYLNYSLDGENFTGVEMVEGNGVYAYGISQPLNNTRFYYYLTMLLTDNSSLTFPVGANPLLKESLLSFWVGLDNIPPIITHFPREYVKSSDQAYTVSAIITDNMGIDQDNTFIRYQINSTTPGTPIHNISMEETTYSTFQGDIPSQSNGTELFYWIEARDISKAGNTARSPSEEGTCYTTHFVQTRKKLLVDQSHGNDMNYTILTQDYLVNNYEVELFYEGELAPVLNDTDMFITTSPSLSYTPLELGILRDYLLEGNSIFVVGGANFSTTNPLLSMGGMEWQGSQNNYSGNTTLVNHSWANFEFVNTVYYAFHSGVINGGPGTHEVLRTNGGEVLCSYAEVGAGRMVGLSMGILSDENIMKKSNYTSYDNFGFARGLLNLLLDNRLPEARIVVTPEPEMPGILEKGVLYTFSGMESHDSEGDIINYTWHMNGELMGYGPVVQKAFNELAHYDIALHVQDLDHDGGEVTKRFYVNLPPEPSFTASVNGTGALNLSESVSINGGDVVHFESTSTDIGGEIARNLWDFGDGSKPVENRSSVIHTFEGKGVFPVVLTIWDNYLVSRNWTVYFTVSNAPPVVILDTQKMGQEDQVIYMSLYRSFDPNDDGEVFYNSVLWDFGDGETQNFSLDARHTYKRSGTYNITVSMTDLDLDDPRTGYDTVQIKINNRKPTANATYIDKKGATITFSGINSTDTPSDYDSLQYYWNFGDGSTGKGVEIEHRFRRDGNFTVVLTVTDDDGANDTAILQVEITSTRELTINYPALALFIVTSLVLVAIWVYPRFRKGAGGGKTIKGDAGAPEGTGRARQNVRYRRLRNEKRKPSTEGSTRTTSTDGTPENTLVSSTPENTVVSARDD